MFALPVLIIFLLLNSTLRSNYFYNFINCVCVCRLVDGRAENMLARRKGWEKFQESTKGILFTPIDRVYRKLSEFCEEGFGKAKNSL